MDPSAPDWSPPDGGETPRGDEQFSLSPLSTNELLRQRIAELEDEGERWRLYAEEKQQRLREKMNLVGVLNGTISGLQEQLRDRDSLIEQRNHTVDEQNKELNAKESIIEDLRRQLAEKTEGLNEQKRFYEQKLITAERELEKMKKEPEDVQQANVSSDVMNQPPYSNLMKALCLVGNHICEGCLKVLYPYEGQWFRCNACEDCDFCGTCRRATSSEHMGGRHTFTDMSTILPNMYGFPTVDEKIRWVCKNPAKDYSCSHCKCGFGDKNFFSCNQCVYALCGKCMVMTLRWRVHSGTQNAPHTFVNCGFV